MADTSYKTFHHTSGGHTVFLLWAAQAPFSVALWLGEEHAFEFRIILDLYPQYLCKHLPLPHFSLNTPHILLILLMLHQLPGRLSFLLLSQSIHAC